MRESLRGALLSVLFFALLIGGAPSMAAGSGLWSVTSAHHNEKGSDDEGRRCPTCPTQEERREVVCDSVQNITRFGAAMGGVGAGIMVFGGPPGWFAGAIVGIAGTMTAGIGAVGEMIACR